MKNLFVLFFVLNSGVVFGQLNTDSIADANNKHITEFLDAQIAASEAGRARFWLRDFADSAAYNRSVEANRERLKFIIGVRDARMSGEPQLCEGINNSAVVAENKTHTVLAVRWQVFDDFFAEGLLLKPKKRAVRATVIYLPHADVSPEKAPETACFNPPKADEQMFIPTLVSRSDSDRVWAPLTNREYVYRAAYQLGRHIIGYEVQEVLALVDRLKQSNPKMPVRVEGHGEGGLLALYAAAVDTRIDGAVVIDYFDRRDRISDEPIDRNVFSLLQQFGDAEIASLVCPRRLTIVSFDAPEQVLPKNTPWSSKYRGAPGSLKKPDEQSVIAEVERAKKLTQGVNREWITCCVGRDSLSSREAISKNTSREAISKDSQQAGWKPALRTSEAISKERQRRIVEAMNRHTDRLLDRSVLTRREFWKRLDLKTPATIAETTEQYRTYFSQNVVGEFDIPLKPLNPKIKQINESDKYRIYQVELDVFDGLQAYGLMLVPKDLKEGEKRPALLCQHGLERFLGSHVREYALASDGPYTSQLCEHGYVCFAPQGIFSLSHRFRHNQRQLNALGKNLFAIMTAQYRQYVRFLQSQPFVDGDKLGFYGCSYGGTTAMFVPPLIKEIGPVVCSANFNYWNFKCANRLFTRDYLHDWQYEVFDFDLANTFDHSDMARLIAPRPFMVERGHNDGVAYDEYVGFEFGKVRYFYDMNLKMPERAEIHFEAGGHFPFLTHAIPFLDKWLSSK